MSARSADHRASDGDTDHSKELVSPPGARAPWKVKKPGVKPSERVRSGLLTPAALPWRFVAEWWCQRGV